MIAKVCKGCGRRFFCENNIPVNLKKKFYWVKENFCSYHCILTVHHHKVTTTSVSEDLLYLALADILPQITLIRNDRKELGLEMDIYIPEIKLGIEINGPVHREPIYGKTNLKKVQRNDRIKQELASVKKIKILVIDIIQVKTLEEAVKIMTDVVKSNPSLKQLRKRSGT